MQSIADSMIMIMITNIYGFCFIFVVITSLDLIKMAFGILTSYGDEILAVKILAVVSSFVFV